MADRLLFDVVVPGDGDVTVSIDADVYAEVTSQDWQDNYCQWIAPHQAAAAIAAIMMSTTRWKLNQWEGFVGFPDDAAHIVEVRYGERLNWDAIDWDEPIATPKE